MSLAEVGGEFSYGHGEPLHRDALHVFDSEDGDSVPQSTWVHTRDIQVIEVPTRIWELHQLAAKLSLEKLKDEEKRAASVKRTKAKKLRIPVKPSARTEGSRSLGPNQAEHFIGA